MGTIVSLIIRFLPVLVLLGIGGLFVFLATHEGASLKLKVSSTIKFFTVIFVMMHLCYFMMLGNVLPIFADRFVSKPRMVLLLFILSIIIVCGMMMTKTKKGGFLRIEVALMALLILQGAIQLFASGTGLIDALVPLRKYIYFFLAIPLYKCFITQKWEFKKFLKLMCVLTVIDYGVRAFITVFNNISGVLVFSNVAQDGILGYRNGFIRLNPPQTDILAFIGSFYLFSIAKTRRDKRWMLIFIILSFLNTLFVWQARSGLIYKAAVLLCLYLMQRGTEKSKLIRGMVLIVLLAIILNSSYVSNLIDSFSIENATTGANTWYRINAINYFMTQYFKHPIFGVGLMESNEMFATGGGHLADIGMLYGLIQLGIPMVIIYIVLFTRGFHVASKLHRMNPEMSSFVFGMTLLLLLTGINIEFFAEYPILMPIYAASVEYLYTVNMYTNTKRKEEAAW